METKISHRHSFASSSSSPVSDNGKRSISKSPRRKRTTSNKSSVARNDSENDDEQDRNHGEILTFENEQKTIVDERSSPIMSDIEEENHQKKRSHHRHKHHHHRHHKEPKSNKRPSTHQKRSVKRSKKETVATTHQQKSDEDEDEDEHTKSSIEKTPSQSEESQSEKEISANDNDDDEEEGIIENNSTSSERHTHRHRKKQRRSSISSNQDLNSPHNSSSSISLPKNSKGTQLIVNYLPASLRESDFYQLFARIAPIKLCKLITDRHTGHSFCYGFIEYHTKEDAIKAIEKLNGYRIEHKKLKVSYAQPKSNMNNDDLEQNSKHNNSTSIQKNANIYITDLPDSFDEKMLERLFSKYGQIDQIKLLRDPRTRISRGVAFVLMTSTRYAERAVKALDGYIPSGSNTPIAVKYADPKKTTNNDNNNNNNNSPTTSRSSRASSMITSVGTYGYPPGLPPLNMIDPYYAAAAAYHHHRAAMNMRDLSPSPPPPPSSYYNSGTSRSSRTRGSSPGLPRSYTLSSKQMTNSSSARSSNLNPSSLAAACDLISKGCQQAIDPNGFVIYAFGLPHECDENDLEELFRRYGDVHRVYIVRNYSTGESKGYSFITMRNYDEACHAVDRLDGSTFQGRTIQVRFKQ